MPLSYLYGLRRFGAGPGHPRVAAHLARLGLPGGGPPVVQVTGTNGKGSCAAMLASIAQAAGLRVGLYTSPHLRRFHERMQIDGRCISEQELADTVAEVRPYIERAVRAHPRAQPGGFEAFTLVAAHWFAHQNLDLVIAEAGIGGAGDATAALRPCFGILTSVGLDHEQVLGTSLAGIACQKTGAWRRGAGAVIGVTQPELRRGLRTRLARRGVRALFLEGALRIERASADSFDLRTPHGVALDLPLPLAGAHQRRNAALAASAALWLGNRGLGIRPAHIAPGLEAVHWPGRLERRTWRGTKLLLDAAHNPAAAQALASALPPGPIHLLVGTSDPHDPGPFLEELLPHVARLTATRASHRGLPVRIIEAALRHRAHKLPTCGVPAVPEALEEAARAARREGATLVVTGSIFLLDEVLACLEEQSTTP